MRQDSAVVAVVEQKGERWGLGPKYSVCNQCPGCSGEREEGRCIDLREV